MILRVLAVVMGFLLGVYGWFHSSDTPLNLRSEIESLLRVTSPEQFRQERDRLVLQTEARFGTVLARQFVETLQPLTVEASVATGGALHFSASSISLFWSRFTALALEHEQASRLYSLGALSLALGLMVLSLGFDQKQAMDWQKLVGHYLREVAAGDKASRQALAEWIEHILYQKERAMDRALQVTFALNRTRLELASVRRELSEMRTVPQENLFEPNSLVTATDSMSVTANAITSPQVAETMSSSSSSLPLTTGNSAATGPNSTPPDLPAHLTSSAVDTSVAPDRSFSAHHSTLETFTVSNNYNTPESIQTNTQTFSDTSTTLPIPPATAVAETKIISRGSSSVRRLLSESQISEPSQLLSYIPHHPDFEPLSRLRQRKEGILVEITPDIKGLLCLAQSYGPEAVTKYYHSLIEFIDRCFIALPSNLACENYSLYWHSRVPNLRQEDILVVIRGEIPHVQWVGEEGVISQIQIHVTLHPLP